MPLVRAELRATDIDLAQVDAAGPQGAPLGGVLQARAVVRGKGDSVHNLMADANGSIVAVIPHGDIRSAFAELTGIDLAGVGLLLTQDKGHAAIRCGGRPV